MAHNARQGLIFLTAERKLKIKIAFVCAINPRQSSLPFQPCDPSRLTYERPLHRADPKLRRAEAPSKTILFIEKL